ncbi:hypothetical protein V5O48_017896 [Marasmius crinis-equi]|uniref:Uncharacterized protein n=1 Tax=Marasmius crinis-equi TaxID=585013 RepID=A0ABR3EMR3_9AGAR
MGRAKIAELIKENANTTKAMLVIKALSEVYPALVLRDLKGDYGAGDEELLAIDPFTAQTILGNARLENSKREGGHEAAVETGTLRPLIEPLGKSIWVFTKTEHINFESMRMAYLHTQHVTEKGKRAVVLFSRHLEGAIRAFEEIMAKLEDEENDEQL